jgi:TolB-like protein
MSSDPEQEYFSDGISEDILNLLAHVPDLRVTSRSSAFSFKGQNLDVPTMAAKLNVAHVLEGSVRKSGNQLRIVAQLIDVKSDTHLWSQTYDRELKGVFAIQDEIAAAVVSALKITLLGDKPKATETNPEAYALYLQARYFLFTQRGEESLKRAETLLKQALEIDPGFAPAWTQLGVIYHIEAGNPADIELARDAIQRALDADPQYGRAYALLARIDLENDWDFAAARQHQQQALALDPGDADLLRWAGWNEFIFGRIDAAIDLTRRSIALDPVYSGGYWNLGYILYCAHRLEEATDSFHMALSLDPPGGGGSSHWGLRNVLLAQGDAPAALLEMEQESFDESLDIFRLQGTAIVQHALGDAEASDTALRAFIECCAEWGGALVAQAYAFRNENDSAFDWLDQVYDERDILLIKILRDPLYANLHDDPRWDLFLEKLGLPH